MRKKILVDIYLANNLGDDMFLDYLAIKYPEFDFVPFHPGKNYKSFFMNYNNVKQFPYTIVDKIFKKIGHNKLTDYKRLSANYDGLLFLGGGIFREESYWKSVFEYRKGIINAFKSKNKPVWFMGCNFGPYNSDEFYNQYERLFSGIDSINFRDKKSFELFTSLSNAGCYPDILWDYTIPSVEKKEDYLGISVINPKHKEGYSEFHDEYIEAHVRMILKFKKQNFKIRLFSFCKSEGDLKICKEIQKQIKDVEIVDYQGNIKDFLKCFGECSYFIAARFHANILAIKYNMQLKPIIYSDKTENLLDDLEYDLKKIRLDNISELYETPFVCFDKSKIDTFILDSKKHLTLNI